MDYVGYDYPKHYRWAMIIREQMLMYHVLREKSMEDEVTVNNVHKALTHYKDSLGNEAISKEEVAECLEKFGGGFCIRKDGHKVYSPLFALPIFELDFFN